MTDLQTRVRDANPVEEDDLALSLEDLWHKLDTSASHSRVSRLRRDEARRPRMAPMRWAAVGVAALAATLALLVIGTSGSGPTRAFAGWSADPTPPATGQLQAAEAQCDRDSALTSLAPTVTDVRGPFSMLVYTTTTAGTTICVTGVPTIGTLIGGGGSGGGANPLPPSSNAISPTGTLGETTADGEGFLFTTGQVGTTVTGVTLGFDDGSRVEATVANGWYAAWWPGSQRAQTAIVSTTSGTTTQSLNTSPVGASGNAGPTPAN